MSLATLAALAAQHRGVIGSELGIVGGNIGIHRGNGGGIHGTLGGENSGGGGVVLLVVTNNSICNSFGGICNSRSGIRKGTSQSVHFFLYLLLRKTFDPPIFDEDCLYAPQHSSISTDSEMNVRL